MTQQDYLSSLRRELEQRKVPRIQEIMADYEEHFTHALKSGKNESEVVDKLGAPALIARAYETESMLNEAKASSRGVDWGLIMSSLGRIIILAPFNFIFMFIPAVILFSLIMAGWSVAGAFGAVALGILSAIPAVTMSAGTVWALVATVFASLGVLGLAAIGVLIMYLITKSVAIGVLSYLQWNLKFVLAK
jgi:uncharacterized membrane protein